jgi:hypothetical protein
MRPTDTKPMGWTAGAVLAAAALLPAAPAAEPPAAPRARPLQVLCVEGTPRWEYRYHRTVLVARGPDGAKLFDRSALLLGADAGAPLAAPPAVPALPTGPALDHFDLVILGDVDTADERIGGDHWKDLARYVRSGGGLLVVAGAHYTPHELKATALEAVLPVELVDRPLPLKDGEWKDGYRPVLTDEGRKHPAFRFDPDPAASAKVWEGLPEMYWHARGYRAKAGAEVLATHPTAGGKENPLPLVVWHKVDKGRCGFVGFDETWRWRRDDGERHHRTFWVALWRSLTAG